MCIGNNVYDTPRVSFEDTILLGLEIRGDGGHVEHVCGYYNRPSVTGSTSRPDVPWETREQKSPDEFGWDIVPTAKPVGNAMLIAIPAQPGTVNEFSLVPVADIPHVFEDYKTAVVRQKESFSLSLSASRSSAKGLDFLVVKGFDQGTYDVVIASSAGIIPGVIDQVDEDKRPIPNVELYKTLDALYPGFTFVLFCFSESDKSRAGSAVVKYNPMAAFQHLLYLPGLDGHNGEVETGEVELNHTLVVGSYLMGGHADYSEVNFTDQALNTRGEHPIFLNRVIGTEIKKGTKAPQGDFLFNLKEVRQGSLRAKRQLPPGWRSVFGDKGVTAQPHFIYG